MDVSQVQRRFVQSRIEDVSPRWASFDWRMYDFFPLVLALAHGINGLRQIVLDFVSEKNSIRLVNQVALAYWLVIVLLGVAVLLGGVRQSSVINEKPGVNHGRKLLCRTSI